MSFAVLMTGPFRWESVFECQSKRRGGRGGGRVWTYFELFPKIRQSQSSEFKQSKPKRDTDGIKPDGEIRIFAATMDRPSGKSLTQRRKEKTQSPQRNIEKVKMTFRLGLHIRQFTNLALRPFASSLRGLCVKCLRIPNEQPSTGKGRRCD
jgi:hypothetical protein